MAVHPRGPEDPPGRRLPAAVTSAPGLSVTAPTPLRGLPVSTVRAGPAPSGHRGPPCLAAAPAPAGARPLALALPALLAIAFLLMPLLGILARTSWGELGTHLTSPDVTEALRLSLVVSLLGARPLPPARCAPRLAARPRRLPRQDPGALARAAAHGAAAHGRRRRPAARLRATRSARALAGGHLRDHPPLPHLRRRRRRHLRRDAVPGHQPGGRARRTAAPLRGDRRLARRLPVPRLPHRDPAHGRAGSRGGRGAHLGPRARRVRRHHHLRRQPPRHHADPAPPGLPPPPGLPRGRDLGLPAPARHRHGSPRRPARPLDRLRLGTGRLAGHHRTCGPLPAGLRPGADQPGRFRLRAPGSGRLPQGRAGRRRTRPAARRGSQLP